MFDIINTKEVFCVSIVVGICGTNFCSLISDGRKIDPVAETDNKFCVLDESFPKVFKVNKRVLLGATGIFPANEKITDPLSVYPVKDIITPRMAQQVVERYLEKMKREVSYPRNYLVGGKNAKGKFSIREIHFNPQTDDIVTTNREPEEGFAISCALPANLMANQNKVLQTIGELVRASKTHTQMLEYVKQLIQGLYTYDNTIGGKIFDITII